MESSKTGKYFVPCLSVLAVAVAQAVQAAEPAAATVSGEVTPKLYYFNYTGGPGGGMTPYLQSYGGQDAWSGNRNNGFFADLDLNLIVSDGRRDLLRLNREGFGIDNHRGDVSGGNQAIGFGGYYSHFRTNSNGVDYVYRPGTVDNPVAAAGAAPLYTAKGNAGYLTNFNNDSGGETSYKIERTRYGVGVKFKPDLLGKGTSLALNFDGYKRDGNKFSTYVLGNGDVTPNSAAQKQARWRGYDRPVNENMGRFTLNFTAAPSGLFQFAYDGSLEKFNNRARTALMTDFQANIQANPALTLAGTADLHFVPDTTLMTQAFRLSKNYGNTALAAGYGMSRLKQDSYSNNQMAPGSGYGDGKIRTNNAFFNINHRISSAVGVEGYVKYYNRDNDTFKGVVGGSVLDPTVRDTWGLHIEKVKTLNYGLAATFNGLPARSNLTVGWKYEDTDRDFRYNTIPVTAGSNIGAWPTTSVNGASTQSNEFYLKWYARPIKDMTLRLTPSIIKANRTGFVTEAEDAVSLKAALGYALTKQTHLNAYYHYKDKENNDHSFTNTNKPGAVVGDVVLGPSYKQKADNIFHAAGISFNHAPSEWFNLGGSLDWAQNDFSTYFFGTDRRRFEQTIVFDQRGNSDFKVDTWSLSLNADYQPTDQLKLRAGYVLSKSAGDLDTTSTANPAITGGVSSYQVSDKIDHTLHSLAFGVDYQLKNKWTLKGAYVYDHYRDKVYSDIDGGHHTVMMGVSLGF